MSDYGLESTYASTRHPIALATTLVPDAYRSAEFYALEKRRLWHKTWFCAGFTQQVAQVGDTFVVRIDDQSILITRSAPNKISAFYNVCRHRGAELLAQDGCHAVLRCPYHAWTYDLEGNLRGTPYFKTDEAAVECPPGTKLFDKADYGLLPVRVAIWGCFIFINLDPDADALETQLGDLPERNRRYPLDELRLIKTMPYTVHANWKLVAENYMEYYHLPWVHPALNRVSHVNNHLPYQGEGAYYGMTTFPLDKDASVPIDEELPHMPGLDEDERRAARWYWLLPNLAISLLPDHLWTILVLPTSTPNRTQERIDVFAHPKTMESPHFAARSEALCSFWNQVNLEDIGIVETVQRGLSNLAYPGGRMCSRFESLIYRFQNHVIDKMVGAPLDLKRCLT